MGEPAETYVDLTFPMGRRSGADLVGEVLWVDPFGNLITSIPGHLLDDWTPGRAAMVEAGGPGRTPLRAAVAGTFGDVARGEAVVLIGSDGLVEVAVNTGSAAAGTGAAPGSPVRICPG
jgi:S-adenosylmethionine hydrolase